MKNALNKSVIYIAVYKHDVTLSYVGQTICNDLKPEEALQKRILQHKHDAKIRQDKFHRTMLEFGIENWIWNSLEVCNALDANSREKHFIEIHKPELNTSHTEKIKNQKNKIDYGMGKKNNKPSEYGTQTNLKQKYSQLYGMQKPIARLNSNLDPDITYKSIREASRKDMVSIDKIRKSCNTGKMLCDGTRYTFLNMDGVPELTKGHYKNLYIGQNAQKIKNLVNGQIYKNSTEAAIKIGVCNQAISSYAKAIYLIAKGEHVLCYLDDNDNEIRDSKGRHEKALEIIKNKGKYKYVAWPVYFDSYEKAEKEKFTQLFKTLDDLCKELKIKSKSHIKAVCDGQRSHCEKFRIAYWNSDTNKPELKERHEIKSQKIIRDLICLDDGNKFNNCTEAGKKYKVEPSQIGNCIRGKQKTVELRNKDTGKLEKKLRFAELDASGNPMLNEKHTEPLSWKGDYIVKYLSEDDNIYTYNSMAEACRKIGIPKTTLVKYCNDPSRKLLPEHTGRIFCSKCKSE